VWFAGQNGMASGAPFLVMFLVMTTSGFTVDTLVKRTRFSATVVKKVAVFLGILLPPRKLISIHTYMHTYTVSQKQTIHLTFGHNFGKCRQIFKILSLTDSQGNSQCNYCICRAFHLTLTMLLHYLVKLENHNCG